MFIIALSLLLVLRVKGATIVCCCESDDDNTPNSNSRAEATEDPTKLTATAVNAKAMPKNYIGEDVTDMDERNPDVIPLTNGKYFGKLLGTEKKGGLKICCSN